MIVLSNVQARSFEKKERKRELTNILIEFQIH